MARLMVDGDELVVRLALWERIAARRGDVRVPLAAVARIAVQPEPWRALRGAPERGLLIPGALCLGVWRHPGGRDFVAIRPKRGGVVSVDLRRSSPFVRIAATSAAPQVTVAELRTATGRSAEGTATEPETAEVSQEPVEETDGAPSS